LPERGQRGEGGRAISLPQSVGFAELGKDRVLFLLEGGECLLDALLKAALLGGEEGAGEGGRGGGVFFKEGIEGLGGPGDGGEEGGDVAWDRLGAGQGDVGLEIEQVAETGRGTGEDLEGAVDLGEIGGGAGGVRVLPGGEAVIFRLKLVEVEPWARGLA